MEKKFDFVVVAGQVICNTTPHGITFRVGEFTDVEVPNCGALLNTTIREKEVGPNLVTSEFIPSEEGKSLIKAIKAQHAAGPNAELPLRIVGSVIAAQAYPGDCVGMTPAPGFERVAPAQKRMNPLKFTVFMKSITPTLKGRGLQLRNTEVVAIVRIFLTLTASPGY